MQIPANIDSPDSRQRVKGRKLHADTGDEDLPDYGLLRKLLQKTLAENAQNNRKIRPSELDFSIQSVKSIKIG